MQLFDSEKLLHPIENVLTRGLWLEQVRKQKHPQSKERLQQRGNTTGRRSRVQGRVTISTHPDSDVQLVFVGEENADCSLLLYRSGHYARWAVEPSALSLSVGLLHRFVASFIRLLSIMHLKEDGITKELSVHSNNFIKLTKNIFKLTENRAASTREDACCNFCSLHPNK